MPTLPGAGARSETLVGVLRPDEVLSFQLLHPGLMKVDVLEQPDQSVTGENEGAAGIRISERSLPGV